MTEGTIIIPGYAPVKQSTDEFHRCYHCEFWREDPNNEEGRCYGDSRILRGTPNYCVCDRFKYKGNI